MSQRPDAYRLRNLSLPKKLAATAGLILGVAIFLPVTAWVISIEWAYSGMSLVVGWGEAMARLARSEPAAYAAIVGAQTGAMLILFVVARWLFARSALRSRIRAGLTLLMMSMIAASIATAVLLPWVMPVHWIAGPLSVVTQLLLLAYAAVPAAQLWLFRRWQHEPGKKKRVVLVGGGFAGLYAATALDRRFGHEEDLEIVVVDRNNYFLFPPLLPSAAAGTIETRQVTFPFRRVFETTNICFKKATVEAIDPIAKKIHLEHAHGAHSGEVMDHEHEAELDYDYLILAPGAVTNTFRTPGCEEHAFFMRELGDSIAVRDQIIDCFEAAAASSSAALQEELLRFVVVGGGPTGVEVATEIHDLIHEVLVRRYPEIDPKRVEILVVQSGKQILPGWHDKVVKEATKQISTLRIELVLDSRVTKVGPDFVVLANGEKKATRTCIWCAGVRPSPLLEKAGLTLDKSGRAPIEADLRAPGHPEIFVLGDAALLVDPRTQKPLPPLGQVAFQQGPHAAKNVARLLDGKPTLPFSYFDFGALVSVGEHYAAVDLLGVKLTGFIGWFVWRTLYLGKLVGTSNRLRIVLDWTLDLLIERSIAQLGARPRAVPTVSTEARRSA